MKSTKPTKKTAKKVTPLSVVPSPSTPTRVTSAATTTNGKALAAKVTASPAQVAAAPARPASAIIEANIDVGFGNQLFVRGQGSGLSWDRGIPLECVDSKTWRLTFPAEEKLLFKLLLNDSVWAKGEDLAVTPGQRVKITPAF